MPDPVTGTLAAASVGGSLISSNSAKSASNTQSAAADRAAEAQLQAARESAQAQLQASREAAQAQLQAARESNQLQRDIFDKQVGLQEPFRQAGMTGQNRLMEMLGLGGNTGAQGYGSLMRDFSMADFQADPGYQFRQDQGMQAIDRLYGGRQSGRAMKDAMRFNQGLADQSYQDAFNRFQTNRANKLQPLQSLGGLAQSSSNAIGSAAGAYGANVGSALMGAASGAQSALMGGVTGAQNALTRGVTGAQNALMGGANARASSYLNQGTNWANTVNQLGALGSRYMDNQNMLLAQNAGLNYGAGGFYSPPNMGPTMP